MKVFGISRRSPGFVLAIFVFLGVMAQLWPGLLTTNEVMGITRYGDSDVQYGLVASNTIYLPLITRDYGLRSSRLGYCATSLPVNRYVDVGKLRAGWYLSFGVRSAPARPLGMEHVQVIRIHQLTDCWPQRTRDRVSCPYSNYPNYDYVILSPSSPSGDKEGSKAEIARIARESPGTLWVIGNEMDRRDFDGGGQDEMLPEYYAVVYHDLYSLIKAADPTAKVAIGGIIQSTPSRINYLDKIWGSYWSRYGTEMPVDVWNVHNFIFKEACDDYGADVPPGWSDCYGVIYDDHKHNDMYIFTTQIQIFRQWMKDHGQQQKPLIVSEYGIVYRHAGMEHLSLVQTFMTQTFDYFMNAKDCNLGYAADECRLVQRWAWYSLDDNHTDASGQPYFNIYAYLIDPNTGALTATGQTFAEYAGRYLDVR